MATAKRSVVVHVVKRGYNSMCFPVPIPIAREASLAVGLLVHLEWDGAYEYKFTVNASAAEEIKRDLVARARQMIEGEAAEAAEVEATEDMFAKQRAEQAERRQRELAELPPEEPETGESFR